MPHASGVHVEAEGRAMVEIAVDHHAEPVRVAEVHIPATKSSRYAAGVVQPGADVEERVVVEHADFGALAGRLSLFRIDLRERIGDRRLRPRGFTQPAV